MSTIADRVRAHGEFAADMLRLDAPGEQPRGVADGHAPAALVEHAIERLVATEPKVAAYVHVDMPGARARSAALADSPPAAGPLIGVPFGVKDVIAVAGMPLGCGSALFEGQIADVDATAVRLLREAGAVVLGKHVTHELTCGLDEPATRNPWSLESYPGGSSAGGGVSVAVRSCEFALGTDAAGSVRIPAAMTGVVGLKPTWGRVSHDGVRRAASSPSIDHVGILAPRVKVAADVLSVVGDVDARDPPDDLTGVRLGILAPHVHDAFGTEEAVLSLVSDALAVLEGIGAEIVPVEIASIALAPAAVFTIFPVELSLAHRGSLAERPAAYSDAVRELLELGAAIPEEWVRAARRLRRRLMRALDETFERHALHALVTPTTPRGPMPLSELDPGRDLAGLVAYTCPFNLTGQPAISLPCGYTDGLPIGLQIAARRFDDHALLEIAGSYEAATGWYRHRPPVP